MEHYMKLIIASNNNGKIKEYKALLSAVGYNEVLSLKEAGLECDPEETGKTFEENAAIKARALFEMCDCAVLADDSGLIVDALNGEPGVYSARWMGLDSDDDKNIEILRRLEGVKRSERSARFVCVIHFIRSDGTEITAKGVCEGEIACQPHGEDGFGYDPIFLYGGKNLSFAQMSADEKNAVSHRGKALKDLLEKLK